MQSKVKEFNLNSEISKLEKWGGGKKYIAYVSKTSYNYIQEGQQNVTTE